MKLTTEPTVRRTPLSNRPLGVGTAPQSNWAGSQLRGKIAGLLGHAGKTVAACVPGHLDVIGGLSDFTGAATIATATPDCICVAVQPRSDDRVVIRFADTQGSNGTPLEYALADILSVSGAAADPAALDRLVGESSSFVVRRILATLLEMTRVDASHASESGLEFAVGTSNNECMSAEHCGGLIAAAVLAIGETQGRPVPMADAPAMVQRIQNNWLGHPVGISQASAAIGSASGALTAIRCDGAHNATPVPLPPGTAIVGVHCGTVQTEAPIKFARVRTASYMGRLIVDRIVSCDGARQMRWDGHLSRISITDYVERFRDRIPTCMTGAEFMERFGETGDPLTRIDPKFKYKIRSRTEHHIYEHARGCQFGECMSRAARSENSRALHDAGELMYASHWSYGQRCGLGSVETDLLVSLLRTEGEQGGIYGAKSSGMGCGGTVVVLMRADDQAQVALNRAVETYQAKTGLKTRIIQGAATIGPIEATTVV